jgi:hypothetical protein
MENTSRSVLTKTNPAPLNAPDPDTPLVISYLGLRKAVGFIGLLLPIVLALGKILLEGSGLQCSISAYYHTDMRNVFVGSLCAIGVFIGSYRGYDIRDEIAGRIASVFAIGVALFPTNRCDAAASPISKLHWTFAAILFLTLAYFCLALFTKTAPDRPPTRQKLQRNALYRACGYAIVASILIIGIDKFVPSVNTWLAPISPVFWLESIAVIAFGLAWLTKGEAILKDQSV